MAIQPNIFSLEGETALITGGGSGLGMGIARCFVQAGAKVILIGRRADVLEKAAAGFGSSAKFIPHDVTQVDRADDLIADAKKLFGPITILANNAGIHLKKLAVDTTPAELSTVLQSHVISAFSLTRAVLPDMIQRKSGNILFTASMASLFGIPKVIAYSAAKSAYLGMVRSLATEVSPDGIRVNAIAPGWIDSDIMRNALAGDPARSNKILERTPMHHFGEADDVGWAATYLVSRAAKFITGIVLPVDGGISIGF